MDPGSFLKPPTPLKTTVQNRSPLGERPPSSAANCPHGAQVVCTCIPLSVAVSHTEMLPRRKLGMNILRISGSDTASSSPAILDTAASILDSSASFAWSVLNSSASFAWEGVVEPISSRPASQRGRWGASLFFRARPSQPKLPVGK